MPPVKIFLADDHIVVRKGLKELIECLGPYEIAAEFQSGRELISAMPFVVQPDLIILDIAMPDMGGKEVMEYFRTNDIAHKVLILTLDTTDKTIIDLYKLGIKGYLPKNCTPEELKSAIDNITANGYYHNELLAVALSGSTHEHVNERERVLALLTKREIEFLNLVCDEREYTYDQVADILGVHVRTVDGYRKALFEKFKIKSKTGVVLFAIKYQLLGSVPVK